MLQRGSRLEALVSLLWLILHARKFWFGTSWATQMPPRHNFYTFCFHNGCRTKVSWCFVDKQQVYFSIEIQERHLPKQSYRKSIVTYVILVRKAILKCLIGKLLLWEFLLASVPILCITSEVIKIYIQKHFEPKKKKQHSLFCSSYPKRSYQAPPNILLRFLPVILEHLTQFVELGSHLIFFLI